MPGLDQTTRSIAERRTQRFSKPIALSAFLLLGSIGAQAQSGALYDPHRILEHNEQECSGAAGCKSVKAGRYVIAAGQEQTITVQCPPATPYFVAWDTAQNESILATAISRPALPPSADGSPPGPDGRLVISARNNGVKSAHITLYLGCAATPTAPVAGIMHSRSAIPSNAGTFQGGQQDDP